MLRKMKSVAMVLVCALMVSQMIGCGTILHPEREGQKGGNIDAGIAVLDGIGLLLFVIPGIIAFVVDFSNGTIYLPHGHRGSLDMKNAEKVTFNAGNCTMADIEKMVKSETGIDVKVNRPGVRIYAFDSLNEMNASYAMCWQGSDMVLSRR